ncbi:unnamed protein product [Taenia asiatica]|uniref:Aminomethyltransferase n=1 Tax=Taenia asiatica TaxID=60517 RepID=A0A0R3W3G7_TAEAS|nr:unnamed protein product [Taenia asiatica]
MVDFDEKGVYADYDPVTHKATHYWVVSLDPHVMTAKRLPALCLRKYKSKHWPRIKEAIEAAEDALKLPVHVSHTKFGTLFFKHRGERIPGVGAIMENVDIPLVKQVGVNIHCGLPY